MIIDLALKTLYYTSNLTGHDIAGTMRLPFYGVVDQALLALKKEELVEVSGTAGHRARRPTSTCITQKGMERAAAVLRRSSYVGPAPVPLGKYIEMVSSRRRARPGSTARRCITRSRA